MSVGLKIKEVADASGFTAATLRCYEQIGLLPEPSRTAAGYRTYDQQPDLQDRRGWRAGDGLHPVGGFDEGPDRRLAVFAASVPNAELIRLVAAEQDCCQCFQLAITVDTGRGPRGRAPEDARSIVESMFGAAA